MKVVFILIEPQTPGNVGAAARAIKTMGFSELRLVNPCDYLADKARWMAHGSNDILENAVVFSSFETAVSGLDFIIGTTAKKRATKQDHYTTGDLPALLEKKKGAVQSVGIVFGREDKGMNNEEILRCDAISSIPMPQLYPSVNLSQAVMIYAYVFSGIVNDLAENSQAKFTAERYPVIRNRVEKIMTRNNIKPGSLLFNRVLERLAAMSDNDINILHSLCNAFDPLRPSDPQ